MEKNKFSDLDGGQISEGWWESVMAEDSAVASEEDLGASQMALASESENGHTSEEETDWEIVNDYFEKEMIIKCDVVDFNKGGLIVRNDNFHGFVPISHIDDLLVIEEEDQREEKLKNYVGCILFLKIIECDQRRGRIVLSERAAQTEPGQRQRLLEILQIGRVLSGRVTNVTDFGVFVDLGGVEGLVHISELSWGRVIHPSQYAQINQMIDVLVLQINKEQCRVSLSVKRLKPNPWEDVCNRYPKGTVINGTITEVVKYGAFARLEDGLEGLIHITEMGIDEEVSPYDVFSEGKKVTVEVVIVDADRQRMSLRLVN